MSNDPIFDAVSNDFDLVLRNWIDEQHRLRPSMARELLCVDAGKALILLGGTYVGKAMGLDADAGLAPALACFREYQRLARSLGHTRMED